MAEIPKCIKCSQDRDVGRRMCRFCYLEKGRYKKQGQRTYPKVCAAESKNTNNYIFVGGKSTQHRMIAEEVLGYKLSYNMVVHHVDDDPKNNSVSNLMVMDRRTHGRLHQYLDCQRVIIEKSMNENCGNCWKTLIVPMTTAWLETTSAKVIKLWEIGQSAAEPL